VNSLEAKELLTEIKEYPYTISHFKNGQTIKRPQFNIRKSEQSPQGQDLVKDYQASQFVENAYAALLAQRVPVVISKGNVYK
jgi:hypothetical protein